MKESNQGDDKAQTFCNTIKWVHQDNTIKEMGSPILNCASAARTHGLCCSHCSTGGRWWSPWDKGIYFSLSQEEIRKASCRDTQPGRLCLLPAQHWQQESLLIPVLLEFLLQAFCNKTPHSRGISTTLPNRENKDNAPPTDKQEKGRKAMSHSTKATDSSHISTHFPVSTVKSVIVINYVTPIIPSLATQ